MHILITRPIGIPGEAFPLTLLVNVTLNVPVGKSITRIVALVTGHLDLLETPLRQVDIACTQVAS